MLKFRYLFDNPDLTRMLVRNWDYDLDSEELFQYFRISANAIYPLRIDSQVCYLRFSPVSEKLEENVRAELAFIDYLNSRGFPAMQVMPSRNGNLLIRQQTPWGDYFASVFKQVTGKQISQTDFNDKILFSYGAALGKLHFLSSQYKEPAVKRWTHEDVFDWIERILLDLKLDQGLLQELAILRMEFDQLTINSEKYGLIHFDFEPDNVFYDEENGQCSVIDFDDAMYHWYVMDIDQALHAIQDETSADDISEIAIVFMDGYRSENSLDEELYARRDIFQHFSNLYKFTRVARAMQERWENEPEWMVNLRIKLELYLQRNSVLFKKRQD